MYKQIIVPMDGSELAECVIPHVETIAKGCQAAEVVFIRVVEDFTKKSNVLSKYLAKQEQINLQDEARTRAKEYLTGLVEKVSKNGLKARWEVINGEPAESIAEYASKNNTDLIVIATHGRSGVGRFFMGSVADRVIRYSSVPVFMVRAPGCMPNI